MNEQSLCLLSSLNTSFPQLQQFFLPWLVFTRDLKLGGSPLFLLGLVIHRRCTVVSLVWISMSIVDLVVCWIAIRK